MVTSIYETFPSVNRTGAIMKKTYEKPSLVRRDCLSAITSQEPLPNYSGPTRPE